MLFRSPVHLLTAVGRDAAGQTLLTQLQGLGVDCAGSLQAADAATGSYTAVLDPDGELLLALAHMELTDRLDPAFLRQTAPQRAPARWLVADLNLPRDTLDELRAEARLRDQRLLLVAVSEPKMARLGADLRGVALLVLNRGELETLVGRALPDDDALRAAWRSLRDAGLQRLVMSDGSRGVRFSEDDEFVLLPPPLLEPASIREVTGAGDALTAGIAAALHRDPDDLRGACALGLQLAALTLQSDATVSEALSPALLV